MLAIIYFYLVKSIASSPLRDGVNPNSNSVIPLLSDGIISTMMGSTNKSLDPFSDNNIDVGKEDDIQSNRFPGFDSSHIGTGKPIKTKDFFDTEPKIGHERQNPGKLFATGKESYNPGNNNGVDPYTPMDEYSSREQKPYKEHYSQYSPRDSTSTHLDEYSSYDNNDNYHDDTELDYDDDYSDYDDDEDYEDDYEDDYSDYAGYFKPTYDYHFNSSNSDKDKKQSHSQ